MPTPRVSLTMPLPLEEYGHAFDQIDQIVAGDWRRACNEWLQRRRENTRVARKQD